MTTEWLAEQTDVSQILRQWDEDHGNTVYDPTPTLQRLAELIEIETENYLKMDPDPFDERHPSRTDPDCNFGHILKVLFRKENFMTRLINDYMRETYYNRSGVTGKDVRKLNTAACRLMLDILPGLEISAVFQPDMESLITRLLNWAEKSVEPLQSYATGLLAAAMEVQDIAAGFREQNARMVPLMLKRLHKLQEKAKENRQCSVPNTNRPFAHLGQNQSGASEHKEVPGKRKIKENSWENGIDKIEPERAEDGNAVLDFPDEESPSARRGMSPNRKKIKSDPEVELSTPVKNDVAYRKEMMSPPLSLPRNPNFQRTPLKNLNTSSSSRLRTSQNWMPEANSNSSWAEMETYVIGNIQIHPPTLATRQMLILRYLTPMGEYQEFLLHVFEQNALELILNYINVRETKDSRLAFEALKYLASLLCHKKFSIEFLNVGGLQNLLNVPRPSVAATGVSICLYYLAYCENAMECVCMLPKHIIRDLVSYGLWLLERSHDSGKCHATMFFGFAFPYKVILEEFDFQDGLRKLYNVISTLPILNVEEERELNDDEECASRQIVRHVTVALKKYMEAHLYLKVEQLQIAENCGTIMGTRKNTITSHKFCKSSSEEVQSKIEILQELMLTRTTWPPVDGLYNLGGFTLLLQIIAISQDWALNSRVLPSSTAEVVKSCLDIISICSVIPKVMMLICQKINVQGASATTGVNLILACAEGEVINEPDVQRAALKALINCVCSPLSGAGDHSAKHSLPGATKKKLNTSSNEDLVPKIWESVRSNNGIMILMQLMMVKAPITDADSIRALACHALAGLARSERVRQIISHLPMFTDGQLQILMRNPILQEKRQEHVMFQKYALELIERMSGKTKPTGSEHEISLKDIHRANVVASTRIQYNNEQLLQLMHQHCVANGLFETAATLKREGNLESPILNSSGNLPFHYRSTSSTSITKEDSPQFLSKAPFTPGTPSNLYKKSSRTSTPLSGGRFLSYANQSPQTVPTSVRTKLSETMNQSNERLNTSNATKMLPVGDKQPIKLQKKQVDKQQQQPVQQQQLNRSLQKQTSREINLSNIASSKKKTSITLDSIITEYLTNQHALCKHPMVTCAKFNLFEPHKCPDSVAKNTPMANIAGRLTRRPLGFNSQKLDRRYIYSRFCPVKSFRPANVDDVFTCCTFSPCQEYLYLGTHSGDIKMLNVNTGAEEGSYHCHDSCIYHLERNNKGNLMLTSTVWRTPTSALWNFGAFFEILVPFANEEYVEFSKKHQDRVIGTRGEKATIYDVATGKLLMTFIPTISNLYSKNRATFSMNDELVLSDGILWDVNSGKEIHKFDKLNQNLNGVFHPNEIEVVSNTEVWDLRTFHLLKTVPTLDQMRPVFSPSNSIIYAYHLDQDIEENTQYVTSFKTLDALDYCDIATYDVKRGIYSVACNKYDTQIAIVENQGDYDAIQESIVRLYDVGRRRDDEDEMEEEEETEDDLASDDGSNSGSEDNIADDGDALELLDEELELADENDQNDGDENEEDDSGDVGDSEDIASDVGSFLIDQSDSSSFEFE